MKLTKMNGSSLIQSKMIGQIDRKRTKNDRTSMLVFITVRKPRQSEIQTCRTRAINVNNLNLIVLTLID